MYLRVEFSCRKRFQVYIYIHHIISRSTPGLDPSGDKCRLGRAVVFTFPVHLLETQMSAVETLPYCYSHIHPAASQWSQINNPPTYSSVSLSLCLSVFLFSGCLNLFCLFFMPLSSSHTLRIYILSLLSLIWFFFPSYPNPPPAPPKSLPPLSPAPLVVLTFSSSSPSLISCIHCPLRWHAHTR